MSHSDLTIDKQVRLTAVHQPAVAYLQRTYGDTAFKVVKAWIIPGEPLPLYQLQEVNGIAQLALNGLFLDAVPIPEST